jgi:NADPH-dependent 2,4-dienoyl-CoA reductase/sulfur reductase-like enzyme
METARLADLRGHRVTLLEGSDRLGGTAWFSQLTTPANEQLVTWLVHEIHDGEVTVRTGTPATVDLVRGLSPDVVVVAIGAVRDRPDVPGADRAQVRTGDDLRGLVTGDGQSADSSSLFDRVAMAAGRVLRLTDDPGRVRTLSKRWMPLGTRIVVVGGGLVGLELAEFLAVRGRTVTVLEAGPVMGLPMAMPRRWTAVRRAEEHGVTLVRNAQLVEIREDEVVYRVGNDEHAARADDVIVAAGVRPETRLVDQLRAAGMEVHVVGDACGVGYIEGAMHSSRSVAARL